MSTENTKPEPTVVTACAHLTIEHLATVTTPAATPVMEGMESLLVRVQRAFNFTKLEMREKIEPAIRRAIEVGPHDEATPIPEDAIEYRLDSAFTRLLEELRALSEINPRRFDFERTTRQAREDQQLLRRSYPRRAGYQLKEPCKVLADAWRATGRTPLPRTSQTHWKRRKPRGRVFVEMIVNEIWLGRSGEGLDSILGQI